MNIHVARTPPFRTGFSHTCCQGQTSGLMVRPDGARWGAAELFVSIFHHLKLELLTQFPAL